MIFIVFRIFVTTEFHCHCVLDLTHNYPSVKNKSLFGLVCMSHPECETE